jgi:hypothetical protein
LKYTILDPRPTDAAKEVNEKIFTSGPVLGIEVTVPALAAQCSLGNIDPQHTGGNAFSSAIKESLTIEIPAENAVLATVRPDLDSIGAMAIIAMRAEGVEMNLEILSRADKISEFDSFARGDWPGQKPLPTKEEAWPNKLEQELAAMNSAIFDHKVGIAERVRTVRTWLETGQEPTEYRTRTEKDRADLIQALSDGRIKADTALDGRIAVVESSHLGALNIGYCLAPVVVALNPALRFQGGEPHRKFTVCQFKTGYVNLQELKEALAQLEPGWGGSPTIIGSPQGVSSTLSVDQVVKVVSNHLQ